MGSDFAPKNEILGAVFAAQEKPDTLEVTLVGKEDVIRKFLKENNYNPANLFVVNAEEVITMHDSPSETYKTKPKSSISVALDLHKDNKVDAVISAGNTGAFTANSILKMGRIPGIGRPTIGSLLPTDFGKLIILDVGAFVDCRPNHLYEFAVMGSIYMNYMFKIDKPRVGILNVGEEKTKGNELSIEVYKLLENSKLNFIGNVEGGDILKGKADVIVCDGFVGNILLKFAESFVDVLKHKFKVYAGEGFMNKIQVGMTSGTLKKILKQFDYQEYGGVPLLGLNGVCIIGHGKSTPLAIKNMIFKAEEIIRLKINAAISRYLSS
jgi:phosphate acyltransferase